MSAASEGTMTARRQLGLENCIYTGFLSTLRLIFFDALPPNRVSQKLASPKIKTREDSMAA
jgi:hypothetical protein